MAQRIEAMHAAPFDTSTQYAPTGQYSLTEQSVVQQADSQASINNEYTNPEKGMSKCVTQGRRNM